MSTQSGAVGIVAGVDGSAPSRVAVDWAARDAALRRVPLTLVYVLPGATVQSWIQVPLPSAFFEDEQEAAREALADARGVAEAAARGVDGFRVEERTMSGQPVQVLADLSKEADMIVVGKGLSGGIYPMAATVMTPELHAFFDTRPFVHVSTFGGAEVGCAAALATLDVTEAPGFLDRVNDLSERLGRAVAELPFGLRRRGLMMGFRFDRPDGGLAAARAAYEAGLLCAYANNDTSVLQFLPPLVLSDAEVDDLIGRVRRAFG